MKKNILFTLLMFTLSINFVFANDNVCQLSKQSNLADVYYSEDGKNIAYKITSNDGLDWKHFIEKDGKQSEKFYFTSSMQFSPDGKSYAFVGKLNRYSGNDWYLIKDGIKSGPFESISTSTFSPDGKEFAYIANSISGKTIFVKNGVTISENYDVIRDFNFFSNGKKYLYVAQKDNKEFIVENGKELEKFDNITFIQFSPDLNSYSYIGINNGNQSYLIKDGIKIAKYPGINSLTYSPDGKRFAYVIEKDKGMFVVENGKEGEKFSEITSMQFSPNSKNFIYIGRKSNSDVYLTEDGKRYGTNSPYYLVKDGVKFGPYLNIDSLTFSPNGENLVYLVKSLSSKKFIVENGKEGEKFDDIISRQFPAIQFSPDGKEFSYIANKGGKTFLIKNGVKQKEYTHIQLFKYLNDGRFIYLVYKGGEYDESESKYKNGKWVVVLNGVETNPYDEILGFTFSPDEKHFSYIAIKSFKEIIKNLKYAAVYVAVIDNVESKEYDFVHRFNYSKDSKSISYFAELNGQEFIVKDNVENNIYLDRAWLNSFWSIFYYPNGNLLFMPGYMITCGNEINKFSKTSYIYLNTKLEKLISKLDLIGGNNPKENYKNFIKKIDLLLSKKIDKYNRYLLEKLKKELEKRLKN